jgi:hypothetical protein
VVVREATSDTTKPANVQGMTVIAIHNKCNTERINAITRLIGH